MTPTFGMPALVLSRYTFLLAKLTDKQTVHRRVIRFVRSNASTYLKRQACTEKGAASYGKPLLQRCQKSRISNFSNMDRQYENALLAMSSMC